MDKYSDQALVHNLILTDKLHRSLVEKETTDISLHRSQHMLLVTVKSFPYAPTQKEIAEKMRVSPATVTIACKKLESTGYLSRLCDDADNRRNRLELTEKGEKALCRARAIFDRIDAAMFKNITDGEKKALAGILVKLQENLKKEGADLLPLIGG